MSRSSEKLEEIRKRVRAMERGGDLDELLNQACDQLSQVMREEMLAERENDACDQADSPPSTVPELRAGLDEQPGQEEARGTHAER